MDNESLVTLENVTDEMLTSRLQDGREVEIFPHGKFSVSSSDADELFAMHGSKLKVSDEPAPLPKEPQAIEVEQPASSKHRGRPKKGGE